MRAYALKALKKGAMAVILIGSLARGDYTAFSDADVVIVVKRSRRKPLERIGEFMDPSLSVDLNPFVYTVDELLRMGREGRGIVNEILKYGKLLAGDEGILKLLREVKGEN